MIDAIAAEWHKLRSLRSNAYLLVTSLLAVLVCAGVACLIVRGYDAQPPQDRLRFTGNGDGLGTGLPVAYFVFGTLGALTVTSEYATGMIRTSLVAVPRRQLFLFAKAPGLAAVTLVGGQVLAFAMHLSAQAVLGDRAGDILLDGRTLGTGLAEPGVLTSVVVAGLSMTAAALIGLGVGAALRSTPGTLVVLVMLFLVVPFAVRVLPPPLRTQAGAYLFESLPQQVAGVGGGLLAPRAAAGLLAAHVAVALTAGSVVIALRGRKVKALAVGVAATLLAGLVALPAAGSPARGTLVWQPCADQDAPQDMRCAAVQVPLDWARPAGRKITIPVGLLPASGAERRIGTVFSVPGGPGASGLDDLKQFHGRFAELRDRFDVVSFAPRNTVKPGGPIPYDCLATGPWITLPRDRAEYAALERTNRAHAQRCRTADPELFDHMDSASVARDLEAVRVALGEERLSILANSYGGTPATAYARLFPARVRAMVLDGAVPHVEQVADGEPRRYAIAEQQLERFAAWCRTATACALHGQDVGQVWRKLVAAADRTPVPVRDDPTGAAYTGFDLKVAAAPSFTAPGREPDVPRWVQLAAAIERAAAGDAAGFADYVRQASGSPKVPSLAGQNMTHCLDGKGYGGYAAYRKALRAAQRLSPNFAGQRAWWPLACAGWPAPVTNPPAPLPATGLPPFLGVGSWTDHGEVDTTVRHVPGSASLRYEGHGHTLYLQGLSGCITAHVNRYLATLRLPPRGTTC
ncbi:alpha/beta fold hydrolase [Nonomuraea gerenzanensis]|uniref:Proteinase (Secreted protein) n=1 Tax=Nonomuraea gerenzanensis TaxID=93944 RepID=A0A1M4EGG6_9ACTN|nr:alpha/beta fold hydrolase [Nonomuraea gerenzanensis]UBU09439.1 alpha/beta fold hydrolase [Nonomuraea gerenzanensis]SBO97854.1 proteinase (secreted protein) [Nonomuraea gerenzanensis]